MNRLLLILITALIGPLSYAAPRVNDQAALLSGAESQALTASLNALTGTAVYIDTQGSIPTDITTYGDQLAYQIASDERADRLFVIVVTTQPRGWRVSMYPRGMVSGESTRVIGDAMAARFKQGRFAQGLTEAANRLSQLANQAATLAPEPQRPVPQAARGAPRVARAEAVEPESHTVAWVIGVIATLIVGIALYLYLDGRQTKRREIEAAAERKTRAERETVRNAERAKHKAELAALKARAETARKEREAIAATTFQTERSKLTAKEERKATEAWRSYGSGSKRQTIVNHYSSSPYYHPGVLSDPFAFYLFMSAVAPQHTVYVAPPPPAPEPERRSYSSRDDSSSRSSSSTSSSSSDSYSPPSSYDSGGSSGSFDSGSSSSDSGGSSGSW